MTQLKRFDPHTASEAEFAAYAAFVNEMRAESSPDDPPLPTAHIKRNMNNIPPSVHLYTWTLWEEGAVIGRSQFAVQDREDNQHLGQLDVDVLPSRRRQALTKSLLQPLLNQAKDDARTLLVTETNSNVPSGEAFMKHLGGEKGMAMHTNQLDLRDLDSELMERWRQAADTQNYELLSWEDNVPDAHLEAFANFKGVMNTALFEDLEIEPFKITPELIREEEASLKARDRRKWVLVTTGAS